MASIQELNTELLALSRQLQASITSLEQAGIHYSYRENEYRKAKAEAYLRSEGTVQARQAQVDIDCEAQRLASHLAEAAKEAALEKVRAIRASLSALQSIAPGTRVELETLNTQDEQGQFANAHGSDPFQY